VVGEARSGMFLLGNGELLSLGSSRYEGMDYYEPAVVLNYLKTLIAGYSVR